MRIAYSDPWLSDLQMRKGPQKAFVKARSSVEQLPQSVRPAVLQVQGRLDGISTYRRRDKVTARWLRHEDLLHGARQPSEPPTILAPRSGQWCARPRRSFISQDR